MDSSRSVTQILALEARRAKLAQRLHHLETLRGELGRRGKTAGLSRVSDASTAAHVLLLFGRPQFGVTGNQEPATRKQRRRARRKKE
jgi:hypothetical protein